MAFKGVSSEFWECAQAIFVAVTVVGSRGTQPGKPLLVKGGKFFSFAQLLSRAKFCKVLDLELPISFAFPFFFVIG